LKTPWILEKKGRFQKAITSYTPYLLDFSYSWAFSIIIFAILKLFFGGILIAYKLVIITPLLFYCFIFKIENKIKNFLYQKGLKTFLGEVHISPNEQGKAELKYFYTRYETSYKSLPLMRLYYLSYNGRFISAVFILF